MNPQHRNALVAGINHTMEGLSQIAQALEADGWEQIEDEYALAGHRPVSAAHLEEPSFHAELEEQIETQQAEAASMRDTAKVRQLILDAGAKALSEVDPAKFGQIMAGAKEIAHA